MHMRVEKHSRERRAFVKKRKYKDQLNLHVTEKYFKVFKEADGTPASCMAAVPENF